MMAISSLELVAVSAWLLSAAIVVWARATRGLRAAEAIFLLVIVAVVPIVGPVAAIGFVLRRRQQTST